MTTAAVVTDNIWNELREQSSNQVSYGLQHVVYGSVKYKVMTYTSIQVSDEIRASVRKSIRES